jgi:hypothetical protein
MFKRIMNSPCQNQDFIVSHLAKDCDAYYKRVVQEAEKADRPGRAFRRL